MKSIKISAAFLSALLVAGTIAALFPSFMIGAQADPYYGMDKDNKKVDKKISVSSLKCNNINVNVNGLTLDVFPPFLGGSDIAAETAEPSTDASSFAGNGGSDKSEFNDFRFICINNNNNTVVGAEKPVPPEEPPTCEECFTQNLDAEEQAKILAAIEDASSGETTTFEELCQFIALLVELNEQAELQSLSNLLAQIFENEGLSEDQFNTVFNCLNEVFNDAIPPPQIP